MGPYLAFLDDDDEWLPEKLSIQVRTLENHRDAGVVYGQAIIRLNGTGGMLYPSPSAPSGRVFERLLFDNFCGIPAVPLVRRDALVTVGGFDGDLRTCEDYDLWLRLAFRTPFLFVKAPVAIYWKSVDGKQMGAVRSGRYAAALRSIVNQALRGLPKGGDYAGLQQGVQATTELRIADALTEAGEFTSAWQRLCAALEISPSLLMNPANRATIAAIAGRYAASTAAFPSTVHAFCDKARARLGQTGIRAHLTIRHLLADLYWETALSLRGRHGHHGRPASTSLAANAALRSVGNDLLALRIQSAAYRLGRGLLRTVASTLAAKSG
jgi:hypothetical protein